MEPKPLAEKMYDLQRWQGRTMGEKVINLCFLSNGQVGNRTHSVLLLMIVDNNDRNVQNYFFRRFQSDYHRMSGRR